MFKKHQNMTAQLIGVFTFTDSDGNSSNNSSLLSFFFGTFFKT